MLTDGNFGSLPWWYGELQRLTMAARYLNMGTLDLVDRLDHGADPRWVDWAYIAALAEHEAKAELMKPRQ